MEEKNKESNRPINNGLTVYYVGNSKKDRQKVLIRGSTSPSLPSTKDSFEARQTEITRCSRDNCEFWPHCSHRDHYNKETNFVMKPSHSYPSHQRSMDNAEVNR